jgi:hypothetical protein
LDGTAASAFAIPYFPPPQPVYDAPIDRALQNVQAMEGIEPLQRELLLGRLNLLAYARNDGPFSYIRENNELSPKPAACLCRTCSRSCANIRRKTPREFDRTIAARRSISHSARGTKRRARRLTLQALARGRA